MCFLADKKMSRLRMRKRLPYTIPYNGIKQSNKFFSSEERTDNMSIVQS